MTSKKCLFCIKCSTGSKLIGFFEIIFYCVLMVYVVGDLIKILDKNKVNAEVGRRNEEIEEHQRIVRSENVNRILDDQHHQWEKSQQQQRDNNGISSISNDDQSSEHPRAEPAKGGSRIRIKSRSRKKNRLTGTIVAGGAGGVAAGGVAGGIGSTIVSDSLYGNIHFFEPNIQKIVHSIKSIPTRLPLRNLLSTSSYSNAFVLTWLVL